jgi:hypothetical protein
MSRTYKDSRRHIRVRAIRKDPPDLRRLARALIALAQAQAEAEAQREHEQAERHPAMPDHIDHVDTDDSMQGQNHEGDAA